MKFIHPIVGPYIEPPFNRIIGYIWGQQAVQSGCPIRPKNKTSPTSQAIPSKGAGSGDETGPSTSQEKDTKQD